jgi:predicted ribosome quality control (RQC) complex YloA/Tae2 family protein
MALDGITVASLAAELNHTILNARISKIAQPEADELLLTLKGNGGNYRLALSANASLPFVYLTQNNKPSPMTAPNFCMLLRKHIANGRITAIRQPGLERIIQFEIEHLDELGDLRTKTLVVELMGKHSNIIFCTEDSKIIDSIKHVSQQMSSIREVLPGREYFIPQTQEKYNPLTASQEEFVEKALSKPLSAAKAIYTTYTGISPVLANEICTRALVDGDLPAAALSEGEKLHLCNHFLWMMEDVKNENFKPHIIVKNGQPVDFAPVELTQYQDMENEYNSSISFVLEQFYARRNVFHRIRQKSVDLRKIVATASERSRKKYDLQEKQMRDTEKRDKYRIYGELINTYGYSVPEGSKSFQAMNYYTNEEITIPLDPLLSPTENAKKYFNKYNKLKRTCEALESLLTETKSEIEHLDSIATSLNIAESEEDLVQIKEELISYGYIRKKSGEKRRKIKSKPFHYLSSDGFHMYVGKNNYQNDELTFKFAGGGDWWFHAKGMPGSHVIVKTNGNELPDRTYEEAARLAAFYSKGRENEKVEIDYLERKNVKKPNGAVPGYVIYYTNYSMAIKPDITGIELICD